MKTLPPKKTPSMLRDFATKISLFCRTIADIGFTKGSYLCIIMQDVYERMDVDTTLRYRGKIELKRELGSVDFGVSEDLDSLSDFFTFGSNNLETNSRVYIELQYTKSYLPKKFNALQNSANYTSNGNNGKDEEKYKCTLGCTNLHKLIECEKY